MQSTITFAGGAGAVTGSNFLLDTGGTKILVDCGLSQGRHSAEEENWADFPYDPASVDTLVVTHAHIDHVGRIPKLVKDGFKGTIISTEATRALAKPLLLDSQELLEHAARRHGRELLYDAHDIERVMGLWKTTTYHVPQELKDGVILEFLNSGHILGSAMTQLSRGGKKIVFTGDLGGGNSPLLPHAETLSSVDYLVMESVYGDRLRDKDEVRMDVLEDIIENTVMRGGTLLIPAFSTERTQDLLFEIRRLILDGRVPEIPVYLDSPLAEEMTKAYLAHPAYFSDEIRARVESGEDIFAFPQMHFVSTPKESAHISGVNGPKIIIAGSGMSNGGRAQGHERNLLPDPNSTLLIVGYQSAGSLGRKLSEGAKVVEIQKSLLQVRAHVEHLYGYSAHMDSEQLLDFANTAADKRTLKEIFVVMGEPASANFLTQRIRDYLSIKATAPTVGDKAEIEF